MVVSRRSVSRFSGTTRSFVRSDIASSDMRFVCRRIFHVGDAFEIFSQIAFAMRTRYPADPGAGNVRFAQFNRFDIVMFDMIYGNFNVAYYCGVDLVLFIQQDSTADDRTACRRNMAAPSMGLLASQVSCIAYFVRIGSIDRSIPSTVRDVWCCVWKNS